VQARCLSFHAPYRCRHTGECCRAGWDVEVEPHIVEAVRTGRVFPVISTPNPFERLEEGDGVAPSRTNSGDCGFHNNNRCSLQECGSEAMLPSACRHFPRVFLRDARGLLMTLSHFCPTAASLLFEKANEVAIVDAPDALMIAEPIEGLDAREALPPLVRPGLLADVDGYGAWEETVVRTIIDADTVEAGLASIEAATERVRAWEPPHGALADAVASAFADAPRAAYDPALSQAFDIVRDLTGPHPLMDVPGNFADAWNRVRDGIGDAVRQPVHRYLAASAFGNWIAYRGQGLRSVVAWLRACHDVLRVQMVRHAAGKPAIDREDLLESIRMADYIMIHTVDSLAFGRAAASLER
jgi:hypothetical protein